MPGGHAPLASETVTFGFWAIGVEVGATVGFGAEIGADVTAGEIFCTLVTLLLEFITDELTVGLEGPKI